MPVYEYLCTSCEEPHDRILPHEQADDPGPCPTCDGELKRQFSRVAVRYEGWGFNSTDSMIPDRPGGRGDFKQMRETAERISDGGS